MKRHLNIILYLFTLLGACGNPKNDFLENNSKEKLEKVVVAIHGGAGTILKEKMSPEMEAEYKEVLKQAVEAGYFAITNGKSSLDAVESSIKIMEDSPLFNAGKGAVFTNTGKNELDASIMDGKTLEAGAVAGITNIKNPILAARAVMEKSQHVMMIGVGAENFAINLGIEKVDPSYFWTEHRWNALQEILKRDQEKVELDHDQNPISTSGTDSPKNVDEKFGTVGCVAIDKNGNLAAGTSTGGMTNKKFGRVGDSPIIGAGTYANNQSVAVSCTGWGEFFIRSLAAYDVSARMLYGKMNVQEASQQVIDQIGSLGGDGGLIALDKEGNLAMPFNTAGMYRAFVTESGKVFVEIYK